MNRKNEEELYEEKTQDLANSIKIAFFIIVDPTIGGGGTLDKVTFFTTRNHYLE
jgi:hypothetical protein